jgi:hypothetical protein
VTVEESQRMRISCLYVEELWWSLWWSRCPGKMMTLSMSLSLEIIPAPTATTTRMTPGKDEMICQYR